MSVFKERPRQAHTIHHNNPTSMREAAIFDCLTRDEAEILAKASFPLLDEINGVQRFRERIEIKEFGGGAWDAIAHYGKNTSFMDVTFDFTAGTVKALQSKETIMGYNCETGFTGPPSFSSDEIRNFDGGIGYNGTHFDGVDVDINAMQIVVNKHFVLTDLSETFLMDLYNAANHVNDAEFTFSWFNQICTFQRGSLRFKSPRVKMDSDGNIDVGYTLIASLNITTEDNFTIGNSGPIEKEGHHYLWVLYEEATHANGIIKKPIAVYVERLYDYTDFSVLQL